MVYRVKKYYLSGVFNPVSWIIKTAQRLIASLGFEQFNPLVLIKDRFAHLASTRQL